MIPVVITASPRDKETHRQCLSSVYTAGFRDVTICCEPGTELSANGVPWCTKIEHRERMGQWRNFVFALKWHLFRSAGDVFCTMEDDIVLCENVAELLEREPWPSHQCGCVQLYAPQAYDRFPVGERSLLTIETSLDMLGACALLFSRAAAQCLVHYADVNGWRGDAYQEIDNPADKKAADTFVGEVLTLEKFLIYTRNPSLADHIGDKSTLGHKGDTPRRQALNFPGRTANAMEVFRRCCA